MKVTLPEEGTWGKPAMGRPGASRLWQANSRVITEFRTERVGRRGDGRGVIDIASRHWQAGGHLLWMEAAGKDKACLRREEHLTDGDAEIARDVKPAGRVSRC